MADYREKFASPFIAARRGYIDDVIEPQETRPKLIAALEACATKREGRPAKKHRQHPPVGVGVQQWHKTRNPAGQESGVHNRRHAARRPTSPLLATRLRTMHIASHRRQDEPAGYWSLEMWGGATSTR